MQTAMGLPHYGIGGLLLLLTDRSAQMVPTSFKIPSVCHSTELLKYSEHLQQ